MNGLSSLKQQHEEWCDIYERETLKKSFYQTIFGNQIKEEAEEGKGREMLWRARSESLSTSSLHVKCFARYYFLI